jgi:electron transfer flavoprotein beta subunit
MQIAVCVKQIPDPNAPGKLDPQTFRLQREGVDAVLDPGDEHAVEQALQIAEKTGGKVTVVSMGPPRALEAIRRALAMGVAGGILITDPALAGAEALTTAKAIAAALRKEAFDLVLCGTESTDAYSGVLPQQLAELLGWPHLTFAKQLEVGDGQARIHRQSDEGFDLVEAPLPAVVTVTGGINEPRYPSLRGIMAAKTKEVRQLSLQDVGLTAEQAAPRQRVTSVQPAEERKAGEVLEDKGDGARRIADFLVKLKVL